jgi:large subunit ribosomal protein L17
MATSLVLDEKVTTTLPKAKELLPYAERLVAKAKKGGLHNRRQILSSLLRVDAATKLIDVIAPQIDRTSGFLRLKRSHTYRHGDGTELAVVSFVDSLSQPEKAVSKAAKPAATADTTPTTTKKARTTKSTTATVAKKEATT